MDKPLVTIMIPVYKRGKLACQTIDCALRQQYENIEVVISDNHSNDGTYELLKEKYANNPRVVLVENNANIGAVENWKVCLSHATGKYAMFLWSDDLISTDYVSQSVSYLESFPNAAFSYSSVVMFEDDSQFVSQFTNAEETVKNKRPANLRYRFGRTGEYDGQEFMKAHWIYHTYKVPVSPACALFKREKIMILDIIPNEFGYAHKNNGAGIDMLIFLNALQNGEKFIFIDKPMSFFRAHPDSISVYDKTITIGYNTAEEYYLKKHEIGMLKWLYSDILIGRLRIMLKRLDRECELAKYYENVRIPHTLFCYIPFVLYKIFIHIKYRKMDRIIS